MTTASADFGLIALVYNLKSIFELGWRTLIITLKVLLKRFFGIYNDLNTCFDRRIILNGLFSETLIKIVNLR